MSASRRGAGDDNILARLERESPRRPPSVLAARGRVAWYVLAALMVVVLIGALVWLNQDNGAARSDPLILDARAVPASPFELPASGQDSRVQGAPPAPLVAEAPAPQTATIVDERNVQAARAAEVVPPLVMLPPEKPAVATPPPAPAAAETRLARAEPAPRRAPPAVAAAPSRAPAEPRASPAARASVALTVAQAARQPARRPAAAPSPSHETARASAPKARKPAPASAAAAKPEPEVDSDVALISAIIMHSSSHAAERAAQESAACGPGRGRKCKPAPAARPKTTD